MKMYKILGIGTLALATLAGCSTTQKVEGLDKIVEQQTTISGKPVSVALYSYAGVLSTVVDTGSAMILAHEDCRGSYDCANSAALISAEIARNGSISLTGSMKKDGVFAVKSMNAGGYKIDYIEHR